MFSEMIYYRQCVDTESATVVHEVVATSVVMVFDSSREFEVTVPVFDTCEVSYDTRVETCVDSVDTELARLNASKFILAHRNVTG